MNYYYRGAFGGSVSFDYMKKYSPVTLALIGINIVIYLFGMITRTHGLIIMYGAMIPITDVIEYHQYWRFLTSMFIHGDFMHAAFNMVILMHSGAYFEQKNNSKSFLLFYISTGLFVSLCSGLFVNGYSIGASGAIFALLGYILYYELQARKHRIPTQSMVIPLVLINVVFSFIIPNVSVVGHLSGLLIGYLIPWWQNSQLLKRN